MGATRTRCYPCLCLFRRNHLGIDFQECAISSCSLLLLLIPSLLPLSSLLIAIRAIDDGQWGADKFEGHAIGCNAVSWAPAVQPGSLLTPQPNPPHPNAPNASVSPSATVKRFATAGCDNVVRIWGFREDTQTWAEEEVLEGHTDWVRDVAWAPNIGLPRSYIATASQVNDGFQDLISNMTLMVDEKNRIKPSSFGRKIPRRRLG